jgi:hypothetical protein
MKRELLLVAVVTLLIAVGACDKPSPSLESRQAAPEGTGAINCKTDVAEWSEGVKMFNGQEVTVWRRAVRCRGGFPNSNRGPILEYELKHEPTALHWKGPSGLDPISFEVVDGIPHLTLYDMTGNSCKGKPSSTPLARIMKWKERQWVEVPHAEFRFDRALLNLHYDYWGYTAANDAKGFIPADGKVTNWEPEMTLKKYFDLGVNTCLLYHEAEARRVPFSKAERDRAASANQR